MFSEWRNVMVLLDEFVFRVLKPYAVDVLELFFWKLLLNNLVVVVTVYPRPLLPLPATITYLSIK